MCESVSWLTAFDCLLLTPLLGPTAVVRGSTLTGCSAWLLWIGPVWDFRWPLKLALTNWWVGTLAVSLVVIVDCVSPLCIVLVWPVASSGAQWELCTLALLPGSQHSAAARVGLLARVTAARGFWVSHCWIRSAYSVLPCPSLSISLNVSHSRPFMTLIKLGCCDIYVCFIPTLIDCSLLTLLLGPTAVVGGGTFTVTAPDCCGQDQFEPFVGH